MAKKRFKVAILVFSGVGILLSVIFIVLRLANPAKAGLYIESTPSAVVLVDDREVGKTPFKGDFIPGQVVVKLVPLQAGSYLAPYQTQLTLVAGVRTVVHWDFGATQETSSGDVITFDRSAAAPSITLAVLPVDANVAIDGANEGMSPIKKTGVAPGDHSIVLSKDGYMNRTISVRAMDGYSVVVVATLASESSVIAPISTPVPIGINKDEIIILKTPTGYLRVRSEPSSLGNEIGRVNQGDRFEIVGRDEKSGWFKILLGSQEGWISNQYARQLTEADKLLLASPTPTPAATSTATPKAAL